MSNQRKIEFNLETGDLHITGMKSADINGLYGVCRNIGGGADTAQTFFSDLYKAIGNAPGFNPAVARQNTPILGDPYVNYIRFGPTVPIASFRPDLAPAKPERVVVVLYGGQFFCIYNPITRPDGIKGPYQIWCNNAKRWTGPVNGSDKQFATGLFYKNCYNVHYDSANPLAGIPDGTEWVDTHGRYKLVNGKIRFCGRNPSSVWIDAINDVHVILALPRYNPDTTVYTPPDWLVALRTASNLPNE